MIICGYAGIGKSYLAHNFPNIIDLESTPFEKDWDRYFKCAKHYSKQGFLVLLSCHKEIRERVVEELPYGERITIFPCINDKELFRKRYEQRGNTEEFIKLQMNNWEKWTSENNKLFTEHLEYMESGETLYDTIIRLAKLKPYRFCTYDGCPASDCSLMQCLNPLEKYTKSLLWNEIKFT